MLSPAYQVERLFVRLKQALQGELRLAFIQHSLYSHDHI